MVYRIGGENIVALAFSQLLKENKLTQNTCITYEELKDYRQRAQKFFDEEAKYDMDFYDIYRDFSVLLGWHSIKAIDMNYLLYLSPLEFVANRNHKLFGYKKDKNGNECIYLKTSILSGITEESLKKLWPRNNMYACYVMIEKVKFGGEENGL